MTPARLGGQFSLLRSPCSRLCTFSKPCSVLLSLHLLVAFLHTGKAGICTKSSWGVSLSPARAPNPHYVIWGPLPPQQRSLESTGFQLRASDPVHSEIGQEEDREAHEKCSLFAQSLLSSFSAPRLYLCTLTSENVLGQSLLRVGQRNPPGIC